MRVSKPPDERRAELLNAARKLFDLNGTANTKVSDIVKSIGVSQGAFYYYFNSKEEIEQAVIKQVVEELKFKLNSIADSNQSFYEKLSLLILLYIDIIDQFTGDEEERVTPNEDRVIHQTVMEDEGQGILSEFMENLVERAVAEGIIHILYPKETIAIIFYGIRSYYMHRIPSKQMIFTIVEQALHIPEGELVTLCGKEDC